MELESLSDALLVCAGYSLQQEKHLDTCARLEEHCVEWQTAKHLPSLFLQQQKKKKKKTQAQRAPFIIIDKTSKISARDLSELAGWMPDVPAMAEGECI